MQTLRIKIVFICFLNVLFKTFKYINGKRIQKNIHAVKTNYIYALFKCCEVSMFNYMVEKKLLGKNLRCITSIDIFVKCKQCKKENHFKFFNEPIKSFVLHPL